MPVTRAALIALLTAPLWALCAQPAQATTRVVHFCDDPSTQAPLPQGPEWGTRVQGTGGSGRQPSASLACFSEAGRGLGMVGPGGSSGELSPGAEALATFTPPAGFRITAVAGLRQIFVGADGQTEAAVFTSTGRPLGPDPQPWTRDNFDRNTPFSLDAAALGDDGAAGLSWGVRCPATLQPPLTLCRGGLYSIRGTITLSDGDPDPAPQSTAAPMPTPAATPAPAVKARVTLKLKRKNRSMHLSGAAAGCSAVTVSLPGKRTVRAAVTRGTWKTTVKHRTGRYRATCATATVTKTAR